MAQINTQAELRQAIADLESKKAMQKMVIKGEARLVKEALSPVNLVKNTFSRLAEIPEVRKTLVNTIIGFGLGYVAKKATAVMSEQSLDHFVGNIINSQVSKIEDNDPDSFFSKSLSYVRKNIKTESPLYPFLGYRHKL